MLKAYFAGLDDFLAGIVNPNDRVTVLEDTRTRIELVQLDMAKWEKEEADLGANRAPPSNLSSAELGRLHAGLCERLTTAREQTIGVTA